MNVKPLVVQACRAVAVVTLAIIPVTNTQPRWWLLVALGAFIFGTEFVSARVDRSKSSRLQEIQHRALRVIADLASVTGDRYDLWVVDIYLPEWSWKLSKGRPRRQLVRALSLTLTDVQHVPSEIPLSGTNPLVLPYVTRTPIFWSDRTLDPNPQGEDEHHSDWDEDELKGTYGAVSVNPIVNNTGHDCRGTLVVHTKPDPELVTTAAGILNTSRGRRHISEACHDIHGHLM